MTENQELLAVSRPPHVYAAAPVDPTTGALVHVVITLLRYRRLILICATIVVAAAVLYRFSQPRTYTSTGSFILQSRSSSSTALNGLAAQFGVVVPGNDANQSPQFFADLIESRELLAGMLDSLVEGGEIPSSSQHRLIDALGVKAPDEPRRRVRAVRMLTDMIAPGVNQRTGVVQVTVQSESPALSRDVAGLLLRAVSRFNVQRRQLQAAAEEQFTEKSLTTALRDLRSAEDDLRQFMESNRDYRNSPALMFRQERLSREVTLRQELYSSLVRAYDQARIEAARDTPMLMIIESPVLAVLPDPRGTVRSAILGLFVGTTLGVFIALALGLASHAGQWNSDASRELRALGTATVSDLRRPWRLLIPGSR